MVKFIWKFDTNFCKVFQKFDTNFPILNLKVDTAEAMKVASEVTKIVRKDCDLIDLRLGPSSLA